MFLPLPQAREITNGVAPEPFRWTAEALLALQEVRRHKKGGGEGKRPTRCASFFSLTLTHTHLPPTPPQATEDFIVHLFEDTNLCAIHAKRVTISAFLFSLWRGRGWWGACARSLSPPNLVTDALSLPSLFSAVPKDLQLARRIRGPIYGVASY